MLYDRTRSSVVSSKCKAPISKFGIHHRQIARAAIKVLVGVFWIHPQYDRRARHKLRKPLGPGMRYRMRVPTGFLLHETQEQILRNAMLARGRLGHLKIGAFVIALIARQRRGLDRGSVLWGVGL